MSKSIATTARIQVFRSGKFTSMEGAPLSYTPDDLRKIAATYDFATAPAPVVVGHPGADAPAYGWVEKFEYDAEADRLNAVLKEIEPSFATAVHAGRYKKVSMAFFPPHHPANPAPGSWYPRHVGFLGAASPAVPGLKNASFAIGAGEAISFEGSFASFGDPGNEQAASLFRGLRDFLISKFGLEEADQALPSYGIEWLSEIETPKPPPHDGGDGDGLPCDGWPGFSAAGLFPTQTQKKKATVPGPDKGPDFATREADQNEREGKLAERERAVAHTENASFAARMVEEGRLIPASQDKLVAVMDALPGHASVSFAAGDAPIAPGEALRQILSEQPVILHFGRQDTGRAPDEAGGASFAADGKPVDPEGLALDAKAQAYQREHPETSYLDAVRAVR